MTKLYSVNILVYFYTLLSIQLHAQCPESCPSATYSISSNSSTNYTLGNNETLSIELGVTYSGTITINGTGTQISNCGTFAGTFSFTSGDFDILNSGTWNTTQLLAIASGSSLVNCTAGTYTKTGTADGIELTGTGTLDNDGTISISTTGGSSKALKLNGTGAVNNDGTMTLYGMLDIPGSNTLTNNGSIDIYRDAGTNTGTGILNMGGASSQTLVNYGDIICHDDASNMAQTINNYEYMEFYNLGMSANIMYNDCRIKTRNNFTNSGYGIGAPLNTSYTGQFEIGGSSTNSAYFGIDAYQTTYTRIDFCNASTSNGGHFDTQVGYTGKGIFGALFKNATPYNKTWLEIGSAPCCTTFASIEPKGKGRRIFINYESDQTSSLSTGSDYKVVWIGGGSAQNSDLAVFGNIYIGADAQQGLPKATISSTGAISAASITVNQIDVVPDYVFEKGYKKISLQELDLFLEKNKHLPDVPSAKEIEKDGLDLGKMNLILLKKIEELTLYILEQDKRIEALENK